MKNLFLDKDIWIYDIEVYKNYFCAKFKNFNNGEFTTFVIDENINNKTALKLFLKDYNKILIGFNNVWYDDLILKYIINRYFVYNMGIYDFSKSIINVDRDYWDDQWDVWNIQTPWFRSIDVFGINKNKGGLKEHSARLGWQKLQDLPYHFDIELTDEQKHNLKIYCENDVNQTELIFKKSKEQIEIRLELENDYYGIDIISKHDAGIAEEVFTHQICQKLLIDKKNLKKMKSPFDTIKISENLPKIDFKSTELKKIVSKWNKESFSQLSEPYETFKKRMYCELDLFGLNFNIGLGGLHSEDEGLSLDNSGNFYIIDIDAASYYPKIQYLYKIAPRQFLETFLEILNELTMKRLNYKKEGNKIKSNGLKICINSPYGKTASKHSVLYDILVQIKTCIFGQLFLLKLIEDLYYKNIKVISANTDGITCKVKKSELDKFRDTYKLWEKETGFNLEEIQYKKYIRRDGNNYIAITENDVKLKGTFTKSKGRAKIIAKALYEYFVNNISVEETISKEKEVINFCFWFQASKGWTIYKMDKDVITSFDSINPETNRKIKLKFPIDKIESKEEQQKTVRWYVSNNKHKLLKYKPNFKTEKHSYISIPNSENVRILNDLCDNLPNDINYQFYIDMTYKIINSVPKPMKKLTFRI